MAMVYYNDEDFNIVPISVSNGRCIYDDKVFVGEEYVNQLAEETSWKF
jgi:hypothetical protein